jgi:tetratricopeptide (TPR) repeat protein
MVRWSSWSWPKLLQLLSLVAVLWLPRLARADSEQAQRLFDQAEQAFDAEDYTRAAQLFEEANRHAPHPSVLFNAAVSWDHAGELARAANAYRAALEEEGLSAAQTEESERRLSALGERLGYVLVAKPIGGLVSVAHVRREPIPARFYLEPGDYQVELETPEGQHSSTSIEVDPGQTLKLSLDAVEVPAPVPVVAPEPTLPPQEAKARTQETIGWIGVGAGVIAAGVAAYLGTQALAAQDAYLAEPTSAPLRNRAVDAEVRTNVAWTGAGVLGGLGVVLLLTSPTVEF